MTRADGRALIMDHWQTPPGHGSLSFGRVAASIRIT